MGPAGKEDKARAWPELLATGCLDQTINHIVKGAYRVSAMNHGRPVYKKHEKAKGLDVLIYFWDDRDGLELCGWWFGPAVGGDQVWAFHPSRNSLTPPSNEWNIPNDGAIDATFSISARSLGGSSSSRGKVAEVAVDDVVRKQLEAMKKEQMEFEARMKEIQSRGQERRRREDELRKRLHDGEADGEEGGPKRPRAAADPAAAAARLEEDRRKLEEDAKRRAEAEAQARQRREEEEEAKRRQAERQKAEEEEERKRREVEKARRKEEEDRRRREEAKHQQERQKKLNELAKRRKEEVSVLAVLDAMSRLACAVPEDFAALKVMFETVMETLLPSTGKQRTLLKAEADRVLKRSQAYVEQASMLRDDWQEWYDLRQQMPNALLD